MKAYEEALKKSRKCSKHLYGTVPKGVQKSSLTGQNYEWVLSKSELLKLIKSTREREVLEKYSKPKTTYRFTQLNLIRRDP